MDSAYCAVAISDRLIIVSKQMPLVHGAVGGAVFDNHWFQWPWPVEWNSIGIMATELAPIVIGQGPYLKKQHVLFQRDNNNLVTYISKGYSKDPSVMHLLRCLWFFVAFFDIHVSVELIAGVQLTCCLETKLQISSCYILRHPIYPLHYQLRC